MDHATTPPSPRTVAVIPIRALEGAKSRLGAALDAEEREALAAGLLSRTVRAARAAGTIAAVAVISPDPAALQIAAAEGAVTLRQAGSGLNEALVTARTWADDGGAGVLVVIPADLPAIDAAELDRLVRAALGSRGAAGSQVALVPDRHGDGTNVLLLSPPGVIPFGFGPGSRARHRAAAAAAGAGYQELDGPLGLDLDTPDDLALVDVEALEHEGRRLLATRPAEAPSPGLHVLPLLGIPEVRPGADLERLLGDALAATPGVMPLCSSDVLVVTQKVVSKAEGAVVDLDTVVPRPEAVAFGERWDRDPRQVEMVLREARRVVRMDRGVLIVETIHGFVCANGGVDASNVGPGSGRIVTLLPRDPDASAARIREAVRARFGVDLPVVISDSFGRPWRWGIVDVAIGVSGLQPLEDLRGQPDADGRIMRSTIRAVVDELASAAELVLGKVAGRPAAIVRGADPPRGEGSIRDLVMPAEFDLFP